MVIHVSRMVTIWAAIARRSGVDEGPIEVKLLCNSVCINHLWSTTKTTRKPEGKMRINLSTLVFDNPGGEGTVLYGGPEHLGDGLLFEDTFLFSFDWQTDIDCAALCR